MNVHYECGHVEFGSGSESVYIERVCDFCITELIDPTDDELVSELGMLESSHPGPDCGCVDCDGPYQPAPGGDDPPQPAPIECSDGCNCSICFWEEYDEEYSRMSPAERKEIA